MEFFEDESDADIQFKNEVIELYNARIDERIRRKKFVIERNLLDYKKTQKMERNKTPQEREIITSMKIFARFNTAEDHERLVNSLIKERLLREVIEQLKHFKQKGLTSLDQIEKYIDIQKKKSASSQYQNTYEKPRYQETEEFLKNPRDFVSARTDAALDATSFDRKFLNNPKHTKIQNQSPMMADPYWAELDNKEKSLCADLNIKPEDYVNLKKKMFEERAKNKKITEQLLANSGKDFKSLKERIPNVFDFWVKTKLISN